VPQRAQARLVGDVAGRKHQCGGLAVQIGDLGFQFHHRMAVAGDVPRSPGTDAVTARG